MDLCSVARVARSLECIFANAIPVPVAIPVRSRNQRSGLCHCTATALRYNVPHTALQCKGPTCLLSPPNLRGWLHPSAYALPEPKMRSAHRGTEGRQLASVGICPTREGEVHIDSHPTCARVRGYFTYLVVSSYLGINSASLRQRPPSLQIRQTPAGILVLTSRPCRAKPLSQLQ